MAESEVFTSLRAAIETTRGTGVNPTRILEQTDFGHEPDNATIRPSERRGSYFSFYRAAAGREKHKLHFGGNLSYQQAAWLGNGFVKGVTTGTGAGADKTYAFLPASATDDVKSFTMEWAYDTPSAGQPGFRLPFVVGDELTLNFDKSSVEGVTFDAQMHSPKALSTITSFGGSPTAGATNAISPLTVVVTSDTATIGTTVDNYWTTATFKLSNAWTDLDTLNNTSAAQDTFRVGARTWSLDVVRYFVNDTERALFVSKGVRKVRIKATGPVLGGSFHSLAVDCYGVWTSLGYDAVDGLIMEHFMLEPVYDTTAGTDFRIDCVTDSTTIT